MTAMKFDKADIAFARHTLVAIVRAVALKRAVEAAKPTRTATFWHVINGGLFDTAIVDWCILFGSDNAQQQALHWKNMFEEDQFRAALLGALPVSEAEWRDYRESLKTYRDQNAAHRDLNPSTEFYPNMDLALEAAFFYFDQLRERVAALNPDQAKLSLRDEYRRSFETFSELARAAVEATAKTGVPGG